MHGNMNVIFPETDILRKKIFFLVLLTPKDESTRYFEMSLTTRPSATGQKSSATPREKLKYCSFIILKLQ